MRLFEERINLELSATPRELSLGETLEARVKLGPPDEKARSGRLQLLYENTYRYEDISYYSDSDGYIHATRTEREETEEVIFASERFPVERADEHRFMLAVPADQPPSVAGVVDWKIFVENNPNDCRGIHLAPLPGHVDEKYDTDTPQSAHASEVMLEICRLSQEGE